MAYVVLHNHGEGNSSRLMICTPLMCPGGNGLRVVIIWYMSGGEYNYLIFCTLISFLPVLSQSSVTASQRVRTSGLTKMNASQLEAYLDSPALEPPPGHAANLVDPRKRVWESYLATSICLLITTLAVGLRMYTRTRITQQVTCADCKNYR